MKNKVIDSKQLWKTIKPLISDKSVPRERINLVEKKEIVKSESETAKILNKFFSNIIRNLGIPDYDNFNPIIKNMKEPVLEYKNHPIILAIRDTGKNSILCQRRNHRRNRKGNKKAEQRKRLY